MRKVKEIKILYEGGEMPDIDFDVEASKKELIYNYIIEKYGKDYVCFAGAYREFKIKGAIKDLGRNKIELHLLNRLTKSMNFLEGKDGKWKWLFIEAQKNSEIKQFIKDYPELINKLQRILLQPRSKSIHPSAIIIFPNSKSVYKWIPVREEEGKIISEWEGSEVESLGFLKEDVLSLSQLDKVALTIKLIKEQIGEDLDIYNFPINDSKVIKAFKEGMNEDVFQFGSPALKSYCKKIKPDSLKELAIIVAVNRPGPIASNAHNDYIDLKLKKKSPTYDFGLKEVVKETFGVWVFQEQVIKALQVLGGLSLSESEDCRRGMGKKKPEIIEAFKNIFIEGAIKRGCEPDEALIIWSKLVVFSGYGFNKSHSVAYSYLGYITMYLKIYYPLQFWTASLQFYEDDEAMFNYLLEIGVYNKDIKVVSVDINGSQKSFYANKNKKEIYWGLSKVAYFGEDSVDEFIKDRDKNGSFYTFEDFYFRFKDKKGLMNKRIILNLIYSGAFDSIGGESIKIIELQDRLKLIQKFYELRGEGKFFINKESWWWSLKQREKSGFGRINYIDLVSSQEDINIDSKSKYLEPEEIYKCSKSYTLLLGGIIMKVEQKYSVNGSWGYIQINYNNLLIPICIWNEEWNREKVLFDKSEGNILLVEGILNLTDHRYSINRSKGGLLKIIKLDLQVEEDDCLTLITYQVGDTKMFKDGLYRIVDATNGQYKYKKVK